MTGLRDAQRAGKTFFLGGSVSVFWKRLAFESTSWVKKITFNNVDGHQTLRASTDYTGSFCYTPGSSVHGDFPGKNTGVGCHFLLPRIFLTQWSNPWLLYCQESSLPLNQGSPYKGGGNTNFFFAWAGTPIFSCPQTLAFLVLGTQTEPYTICSLGSQAFRLGLNYTNC